VCRISTARDTVSPIAQKLQGGKAKNAWDEAQRQLAAKAASPEKASSGLAALAAS
jgi:hypothetical protein